VLKDFGVVVEEVTEVVEEDMEAEEVVMEVAVMEVEDMEHMEDGEVAAEEDGVGDIMAEALAPEVTT
jgi:hypothetical protein